MDLRIPKPDKQMRSPTGIYLTAERKTEISEIAKKNGVSASKVMNYLIDVGLKTLKETQ